LYDELVHNSKPVFKKFDQEIRSIYNRNLKIAHNNVEIISLLGCICSH